MGIFRGRVTAHALNQEADVNLKIICVYCASSPRAPASYLDAAGELGRTLAREGLTLLYGGGAVGVMGAVANGALALGGRVVGVRPTFISALEDAHPDASEMIFTETMHQRKQLLVDRADAFVALPVAIGTLDELIETITWKRLGLHNKPICILNVDGFFDPLLRQFERLVEQELVAERFLSMFGSSPDADGVMAYLRGYVPTAAEPVMWETP